VLLLSVQNYAWHSLLNCRQKGVKLKLGIYIDDDHDDDGHEAVDVNNTDQVSAAADTPAMGM